MRYVVFSILIILVLLSVSTIFFIFGGSLFSEIKYVKNRKIKPNVTVLGKRDKLMLRQSGPYTNYFVTFKLAEDDILELPVSKKLYKTVQYGDVGELEYYGDRFYSFTMERKRKKDVS